MERLKLHDLPVGARIYTTGDMANPDGFGTIAKQSIDKWGQFVDVSMDDGRKIKRLPVSGFTSEFLGYGGTRFVTLAAYNAFRHKQGEGRYQYQDAK